MASINEDSEEQEIDYSLKEQPQLPNEKLDSYLDDYVKDYEKIKLEFETLYNSNQINLLYDNVYVKIKKLIIYLSKRKQPNLYHNCVNLRTNCLLIMAEYYHEKAIQKRDIEYENMAENFALFARKIKQEDFANGLRLNKLIEDINKSLEVFEFNGLLEKGEECYDYYKYEEAYEYLKKATECKFFEEFNRKGDAKYIYEYMTYSCGKVADDFLDKAENYIDTNFYEFDLYMKEAHNWILKQGECEEVIKYRANERNWDRYNDINERHEEWLIEKEEERYY